MISALLRAYFICMAVLLAAGAAIGTQEEYEAVAASIWCRPGEVLVYVWDEDEHGRPVKRSMRRCRPADEPATLFIRDADGKIMRAR